jgi:hypothetical protein
VSRQPYGLKKDGSARCINAEPGTFSHECGRQASWIGAASDGWEYCFCDRHKANGHDARHIVQWRRIEGAAG